MFPFALDASRYLESDCLPKRFISLRRVSILFFPKWSYKACFGNVLWADRNGDTTRDQLVANTTAHIWVSTDWWGNPGVHNVIEATVVRSRVAIASSQI